MNILIFDIEITGHHPEYIGHLVSFISKNKNNTHKYYFVVHPDFSTKFPEIVAELPEPTGNFITISNSEFNDLYSTGKNGSQRKIESFKIYDLLLKYSNEIKPDRCILMYFNRFLKSMLIKRPGFDIYGILFSPFIRSNVKKDFKSKTSYFKKRVFTYLYTRNKKIRKIFVLNDRTVVNVLNKQNRKNIFQYLADPIPEIKEEAGYNIRALHSIDNSKKILLHFGSLRETKGTLELIQSLNLLSDEAASKCCLIIAGRPKDSIIEKQIQENIDNIKKVQIVYICNFISNSQMKSIFNQSDIVLMPYKNSLASSGVIGHAIISEKPVISTKHGLIGELLRTNWVGELLDVIEPESIAKAIEKSVYKKYPVKRNDSFILEHTPDNFAKTILENIE